MDVKVTKNQTIILSNINEQDRDVIALHVLKGRLGYAIRVGRTDGMALAKARQLAEKYGWPEGTKTMKQAERFVLAALKVWKGE